MAFDSTKAIYLSKLFEVLEGLGHATAALMQKAGIRAADLSDRERPIPLAVYLDTVERAVQSAAIPDLGFRVGEQTTPLEHGVLGYALISSPNLRESLRRYVRYQHLQGPLLTVTLDESEPLAALTARPVAGRWRPRPAALRYFVQEWLVGWNHWTQLIGRSGSFFEHVRLGYAADENDRYYAEHLGCTVSFDNPETTAVFRAAYLDRPLEFADESIAALCAVQCDRLLELVDRRAGLAAEIHRVLAAAPGNVPGIDAMADSLHVGARTLRRRLKAEGTTYRQIVSEHRVAMARRYLSETRLPANEIAHLVGYADAANLYRVFRKAAGETPHEYRSRQHPT